MNQYMTIFIASLLGSLHCIGMCGTFTAITAGGPKPVQLTIAYHLGRLITYMTLGAVAGSLSGQVTALMEQLGPFRAYAHLLVATSLVLTAVFLLWLGEVKPSSQIGPFRKTLESLRHLAFKLGRHGGYGGALVLGLSSTLLPCGWLWSFVLIAGSSGTAFLGAGLMLSFWLGGLPALLSIGFISRVINMKARRIAPKLGAIVLTVMAFLSLGQKWIILEGADTQSTPHCSCESKP